MVYCISDDYCISAWITIFRHEFLFLKKERKKDKSFVRVCSLPLTAFCTSSSGPKVLPSSYSLSSPETTTGVRSGEY